MMRPPLTDFPYDAVMDPMLGFTVLVVCAAILIGIGISIYRVWPPPQPSQPSIKSRWLDNPPDLEPLSQADLHKRALDKFHAGDWE